MVHGDYTCRGRRAQYIVGALRSLALCPHRQADRQTGRPVGVSRHLSSTLSASLCVPRFLFSQLASSVSSVTWKGVPCGLTPVSQKLWAQPGGLTAPGGIHLPTAVPFSRGRFLLQPLPRVVPTQRLHLTFLCCPQSSSLPSARDLSLLQRIHRDHIHPLFKIFFPPFAVCIYCRLAKDRRVYVF